MDVESNGEIEFLGTLLNCKKCKDFLLVYRNPTHTDQYLHYRSHHQTRREEVVFSSFFNRTYFNINNKDDLTKETARKKQGLKENGYQKKYH